MKIGIITSTIRPGRAGLDIAKWTHSFAKEQNYEGVEFNIIDIADFDLPMFGAEPTPKQAQAIQDWKDSIANHDGFVFVTAEYNHAITGVLKNALDYLKPELANKAAAFVGYGGVGGARAIENLRLILAELQVATTQKTVNFMLALDFENYSVFKPQNYHTDSTALMFDQLINWTQNFKK